jgi:hypothetical protein
MAAFGMADNLRSTKDVPVLVMTMTISTVGSYGGKMTEAKPSLFPDLHANSHPVLGQLLAMGQRVKRFGLDTLWA